jgi:hypothetical protein
LPDIPVTFPPGRARLATKPSQTGSLIPMKTIGIGHKGGGPFILSLQVSPLDGEISFREVALLAEPLKK